MKHKEFVLNENCNGCPYCGGEETHSAQVDFSWEHDGWAVSVRTRCDDCDRPFSLIFALDDVEEVE